MSRWFGEFRGQFVLRQTHALAVQASDFFKSSLCFARLDQLVGTGVLPVRLI